MHFLIGPSEVKAANENACRRNVPSPPSTLERVFAFSVCCKVIFSSSSFALLYSSAIRRRFTAILLQELCGYKYVFLNMKAISLFGGAASTQHRCSYRSPRHRYKFTPAHRFIHFIWIKSSLVKCLKLVLGKICLSTR